jgi:thiamine-phosphate diphosphorylase / hydroxyethylthiazole kinase
VNASNTRTVLAQSSAGPRKSLDGVAVVSALVAAPDPAAVARDLLAQVVAAKVPDVISAVAKTTPLSHNMTNLVSALRLFPLALVILMAISPVS